MWDNVDDALMPTSLLIHTFVQRWFCDDVIEKVKSP